MRFLKFSLILFLAFSISCASTPSTEGVLVPIKEIATPENAQKALIIAQQLRYSYMQYVKDEVRLGKRDSSALMEFERKDSEFRNIWSAADDIVTIWKLKGDAGSEEAFKKMYSGLLDKILELKMFKD